MTTIHFEAQFRGGLFGYAEFKLRRNGFFHSSFVIRGSGSRAQLLEDGLYLISVYGVAPPNGAIINIDGNTSPSTPDEFHEGPIFKSYVLNLNQQL